MSSPARRLVFALVLFLFLAPTAALAQNQARMSGTVTDHEGNPVSGAVVRLEPTDDKGTLVDAKTKKKGNYLIGMIRPGPYKLAVDAPNGMVILRMQGNGKDVSDRRKVLWEVDSEVSVGSIPPINVGYLNQIELNLVVGPPSMSLEARAEQAVKEAQDSYAAGLARIKEGDYEGALVKLEPLLAEDTEHAGTNYLVAFAETHLGRFESALGHVDRAAATDPNFAGTHVLRGRIFRGLDRNADAEREFLAEIESGGAENLKMEAQIALAILYDETGRKAEAITILEDATELKPQRDVLLKLADLYASSGQREKAAATLERAETVGGMDDVAMLNLAIGYINERNYDEAERLALRLVETGAEPPNLSMAHSVLARCDLNRGKLSEGAEHLRKALELDPASSLAAENREILKALGK